MEQLATRASQADNLIKDLLTEIASVRNSILSNWEREEEKKLISENERLKDEVNQWKNKLTQLETSHGVKQVPIPVDAGSKIAFSEPAAGSPIKPAAETGSAKKSKKPKQEVDASKPTKQPPAPSALEVVDVSRLDIRVGKIIQINKHPDADSLYVEQIDVGEEKPRTVISGLVKHIPIEEMQNRVVLVLCNLKPVKMRGILSEGMVMCAVSPDKIEVLSPPDGSTPGETVFCQGFEGKPDGQLIPKKKVFEQVAPDLKTNDQFEACYKGINIVVPGKGLIKSQSLPNTQIK